MKLERNIKTKNADKVIKKKNKTPIICITNILRINRTQY
jgi:hypothetical protein